MNISNLVKLATIIRNTGEAITFKAFEIGARPAPKKEIFHSLVELFPGTRIVAFEVDEKLCNELNQTVDAGVEYHPVALGRSEETRDFYETMDPMCSSLYKPNEKLLERYNSMEVARLRSIETIATVSMDWFVRSSNTGPVDFIKIDIQGAELDVFQGGVATLNDVVFIVCEVEFIPLYENQPLFGDVQSFLSSQGLEFHKFIDLNGRTLKPVIIGNNPVIPTQHMWSDAVFIKSVSLLDSLDSARLLKMAFLAFMYGSPDVTMVCLKVYDSRTGSSISAAFMKMATDS